MRFVDQAVIRVRSGGGGAGCISFRREKYVPKGGPNGGDGGRGGSVLLRGRANLQTLADLQYRRFYKAERGRNGQGSNRHGRNGEDAIILLPLGTDAFDADTGKKLGEVLQDGETLVVAQGGQGGRGNARFATATNQAPRRADPGGEAVELNLKLVLRLVADIGFVGLPNAGKSTLLSALTRANPRVASYPFTTLTPNLGVMTTKDFRYTVADMPGIIEGAHEGKGLGLLFLRHIERTRMLVFVLDAADGHPAEDYRKLCAELDEYNPDLNARPRVVVLNKRDLLEEEPTGEGIDAVVVVVSALARTGVDRLHAEIERMFPG